MSNLIRWNPAREFAAMDRLMDRMLNQFWGGQNGDAVFGGLVPATDVHETENEIVVKAELPGFNPDQIDIRVEGNVLTIKGQVSSEQERKEEGQVHLRERRMSSFQRSFSLPVGVDPDKAEANFENGVLTLTLPKREDARARRIAVNASRQIEAQGANTNGNKR
ncbi:MAG: Hsp20/alpha crystallin family protein [Anaerolineae bacterium]|nr:Hsp20/alpha crystallin family protein [Anaerolineae bacterium]